LTQPSSHGVNRK